MPGGYDGEPEPVMHINITGGMKYTERVHLDPSGADPLPPFDPPLANPIQFAIERNDCECSVCRRARAAAEEVMQQAEDLLRMVYVKLPLYNLDDSTAAGKREIQRRWEVRKCVTDALRLMGRIDENGEKIPHEMQNADGDDES